MDDVRHRGGDAAAHRKATAGGRALTQRMLLGDLVEVDPLGLEHSHDLLKGQHEVNIAADGAPAGLKLLGAAGTDEGNFAVLVLLLEQTGGKDHRGEGHRDVGRKIGEELFRHDRPGGAAGGRHKGQLAGDLLDKVLRLIDGAQVGADRNLRHIGKAQQLHRSLEPLRGDLRAELADKGGGDCGVDPVAVLDRVDQLEDLALVRDGAERAVDNAHPAGDALVIIDGRTAQLIAVNRVHAAGGGAGALLLDDGMVGAGLNAAAALDAFGLVDHALAVDNRDRTLGANLFAGVRKAALTAVGTRTSFSGQALQANLMMLTRGGS